MSLGIFKTCVSRRTQSRQEEGIFLRGRGGGLHLILEMGIFSNKELLEQRNSADRPRASCQYADRTAGTKERQTKLRNETQMNERNRRRERGNPKAQGEGETGWLSFPPAVPPSPPSKDLAGAYLHGYNLNAREPSSLYRSPRTG